MTPALPSPALSPAHLMANTVPNGQRDPHRSVAAINHGQCPFWLQHATKPGVFYAHGVETDHDALMLWADPYTGYSRIVRFPTAEAALAFLTQELGPRTPLALVWDERPIEAGIPFAEEQIHLTKAKASWRPCHPPTGA